MKAKKQRGWKAIEYWRETRRFVLLVTDKTSAGPYWEVAQLSGEIVDNGFAETIDDAMRAADAAARALTTKAPSNG